MTALMRTLMISLVLLLAACGQKGPLYLPQDPAQPAASAAAVPAATTVSPSATASEQKEKETDKQVPSQPNTEAEAVAK